MVAWKWLAPILDRPEYPYYFELPQDPINTIYLSLTMALVSYILSSVISRSFIAIDCSILLSKLDPRANRKYEKPLNAAPDE